MHPLLVNEMHKTRVFCEHYLKRILEVTDAGEIDEKVQEYDSNYFNFAGVKQVQEFDSEDLSEFGEDECSTENHLSNDFPLTQHELCAGLSKDDDSITKALLSRNEDDFVAMDDNNQSQGDVNKITIGASDKQAEHNEVD